MDPTHFLESFKLSPCPQTVAESCDSGRYTPLSTKILCDCGVSVFMYNQAYGDVRALRTSSHEVMDPITRSRPALSTRCSTLASGPRISTKSLEVLDSVVSGQACFEVKIGLFLLLSFHFSLFGRRSTHRCRSVVGRTSIVRYCNFLLLEKTFTISLNCFFIFRRLVDHGDGSTVTKTVSSLKYSAIPVEKGQTRSGEYPNGAVALELGPPPMTPQHNAVVASSSTKWFSPYLTE